MGEKAVGIIVPGGDNSVGEEAFNILLHGNGNTVAPGVQNVAMLNTNNKQVFESDLAFISDLEYKTLNIEIDDSVLSASGKTIKVLQEKHENSNAATFNGGNQAGNLIVVFYSGWDPSGVYTCTDDNGNTYTRFQTAIDSSSFSTIIGFYAWNINGDGPPTITCTGINHNERVSIYEVSGVDDASDPLDVSDSTSGDADPLQVTLTPTQDGFIIGGWANLSGDQYLSPTDDVTQLNYEIIQAEVHVINRGVVAGNTYAPGVNITATNDKNVFIAASFRAKGGTGLTIPLITCPKDGTAIDIMEFYSKLIWASATYTWARMTLVNALGEEIFETQGSFISGFADATYKGSKIPYYLQLRPGQSIYLNFERDLGGGDSSIQLTISYRRI